METKYVFINEEGREVNGIAAPCDIGDKIINRNGEFEVIGLVNEIETTKTVSIFRNLFKCRNTEDIKKEHKQMIILRRNKKD